MQQQQQQGGLELSSLCWLLLSLGLRLQQLRLQQELQQQERRQCLSPMLLLPLPPLLAASAAGLQEQQGAFLGSLLPALPSSLARACLGCLGSLQACLGCLQACLGCLQEGSLEACLA